MWDIHIRKIVYNILCIINKEDKKGYCIHIIVSVWLNGLIMSMVLIVPLSSIHGLPSKMKLRFEVNLYMYLLL